MWVKHNYAALVAHFCITVIVLKFVFAAGLDRNSNGSLNTASACSSIDENSDDAVLQPVKEQ